jgi:DNA end-binding protein Ku
MRSMWRGAISFGLVTIPVRLYTATEQRDIAFRQVHNADGGRIRFRRFCSTCGDEVPYEDIAKGYELPGGDIIMLSDEDMADLPLPTTRAIEVLNFTPADQLDPILFNRSYFVEPEPQGVRAYALLRDALEGSDRVAVAQVALRQREALATLRAREGVLVLETLLWPDEVRDADFGFLDGEVEVRPQELQMAQSLIDSMTVDFKPDEYHDRYREALQEVIDAKVEGREIVAAPAAEGEGAEVTSLTDALRASLAAVRGEGADREAAEGKPSTGAKRPRGAGQARETGGDAAAGSGQADAADGAPRQAGRRSSRAKQANEPEEQPAEAAPAAQRRTRRRAS